MTWQEQTTVLVRHLVADIDEPQRYSDSRIVQTVVIAATMLLTEISFPECYAVDIQAQTITPEPTDEFNNLASLKAAMLIVGSELKIATDAAIDLRDAQMKIDLSAKADLTRVRYQSTCDQFDFARKQFLSGTGGAAIGPYSTGAAVTRQR